MNTLTLQVVMCKKRDLERVIYEAVKAFTEDTGLNVESCRLYSQEYFGKPKTLVAVNLEVKLP